MDIDQSCQEFPEHSPEVFDFLSEYFEDVESGESHGLEHYLRRFPGCEEAIRKEFHELTSTQPVARQVDPQPTQKIGPYELLSEIGRGGQGVVYLAEDTRIARRVALKVLPPAAVLFSDARRRRLQREAEVISRLAHPGICGIYDADMDGEFAYIAMPLIEGQTLASMIGAAGLVDGEVSASSGEGQPCIEPQSSAEFASLLHFFERAARALHSAHEAGVIHRDVKPGNLMVTPAGAPVWLDFGQARDAQTAGVDLTLSGEIFGTPAYMSPEQVTGGVVDERTDVWALTVSLFEALTRRRPFEGATAHVLMLSIKNDPALEVQELNPHVSCELAVVVATGLERDLGRRYSSALALAEDLARLQVHEPILAQAPGTLLLLRRWSERHPALAVLALAVIVALMVTTRLVILKDAALDVALGRLLAGRSEALLEESPASALLLAIQAVEKAPDAVTRARLFGALEACTLRAEYEAGHERLFLDVLLVPGGQFAAAVLFDGEVALFDLLSGNRVLTWRAHAACTARQGAHAHLAASPDGKYIASGGEDGRVVVAEIAGTGPRRTFDGPGGGIVELLFGNGGRTLLVRADVGGLVLYDALSGEPLRVLDAQGTARTELALDTERGCFYERSSKPTTKRANQRWQEQTGVLLLQDFPPASSTWAQWSRAGWVWLEDNALCRGSMEGMGQRSKLPLPGGEVFAHSEEAPELQLTLAGSGDHCLLVMSTPESVRCFIADLRRGRWTPLLHDFPEAPRGAQFSNGEERLALVASNSRLLTIDSSSGKVLSEGVDYMRPEYLQWSADDRFILARQYVGPQAQLWYGTQRPDLYRMECGDGAVIQAEFAGDGERAFTLTNGGDLRLWSTPSQATASQESGELLAQFSNPEFPVRGAAFTPDRGQLLAWGPRGAASYDVSNPGRLRRSALSSGVSAVQASEALDSWLLLDEQNQAWVERLKGGELQSFAQEKGPVQFLLSVPQRPWILTAHASGELCCWEGDTLQLRWSAALRQSGSSVGTFQDLAFSPDGQTVAVAWSPRSILFRRLDDGMAAREALAVFPPKSLDWSSDGRRLVISGRNGRGAFRVEDLRPATPEQSWMRAEDFHGDNLTGASFSPDGAYVLSTSADGTVMVRDVRGLANPRSTVLVAQLHGDGGAVRCADFSPGAGPLRVIAGLENGTARVWPVDPLPAAQARLPRQKLREWEFAREQRFAAPLDYR